MKADYMERVFNFANWIINWEEETVENKAYATALLSMLQIRHADGVKSFLSKMSSPGAEDLLWELEREEAREINNKDSQIG